MIEEKYYTDLDLQLQSLAAVDWATFVQIVGEDNIISAKAKMLKAKGCSLQQIANRLDISKATARYRVQIEHDKLLPVIN